MKRGEKELLDVSLFKEVHFKIYMDEYLPITDLLEGIDPRSKKRKCIISFDSSLSDAFQQVESTIQVDEVEFMYKNRIHINKLTKIQDLKFSKILVAKKTSNEESDEEYEEKKDEEKEKEKKRKRL
jgi:hypothetical protein